MSLSDQLNSILNDLQAVWTESALMLGAILLLIAGLISSRSFPIKAIFALTLLAALYLNLADLKTGAVLMDSLFLEEQSGYFGSLFLLVALMILIYRRSKEHAPEFYFLILAMLAGCLFIMKANSLLVVYLAIELVSFSSYILTNFSFKKSGFEAGIKYLLFGAICSAIMLFGLGLIYGSTGTFYISNWSAQVFSELLPQVGFVMILMGVFFKISIAPSHMWVPATYQSAPPDAVAFMSIVPKLATLILLQRFFTTEIFSVDHWIVNLCLSLGMLTIIAGTLGAFLQTNARRIISFGAVAHSGFLLPFVIMTTETSSQAFWWYAVAYAVMNLAVFYLLDSYEKQQIHLLADYKKTDKQTWIGVAFLIVLVSLVGLPPLAGFTAKFFLFSALWEFYQATAHNIFIGYLIVAILATVGSLFYYLQIPKNIFLEKNEGTESINFAFSTKIIATLFCIALLLLFFAPKLVMLMQQLLNNIHE